MFCLQVNVNPFKTTAAINDQRHLTYSVSYLKTR